MNNDPVDETWFDEVQNMLYKALLKVFIKQHIKNIYQFLNI